MKYKGKKDNKNDKKLILDNVVTCRLCGSSTETRVKIEENGYKHCKNCGNHWY